jgi:hypothetical protein
MRRASDLAAARMERAAVRGDRVAWLIALGYYEGAMDRRAKWEQEHPR